MEQITKRNTHSGWSATAGYDGRNHLATVLAASTPALAILLVATAFLFHLVS